MERILIFLRAGKSGGRIYNVYINNRPISYVYKVFVLWKNGPGIAWYFPLDTNGTVLMDINNSDRLATAFRFGFIRIESL